MPGHIECIGMRFENNGHPYVIKKELGFKNGTNYVQIEYDSGFVETKAKYAAMNCIGCKDRLSPSVNGVGCLGYAGRTKDNHVLFDCWRAMIARCYNPKNPSYKTYGARGVDVCDRWKRFDFFMQDVTTIDGYNEALVNNGLLDLDKDIKVSSNNNRQYNKENCCWITRRENVTESNHRNKIYRSIK